MKKSSNISALLGTIATLASSLIGAPSALAQAQTGNPSNGTAAASPQNKPDQAKLDAALLEAAYDKGNVDKIKSLLKQGANPNAQDQAGKTALANAVISDNPAMVKALIQGGAHDLGKDNALNYFMGNPEVLKQLLELYWPFTNIDRPNSGGRTPLFLAVSHGKASAVQALLANGANPNIKDREGATVLDYAKAGAESTDDPNKKAAYNVIISALKDALFCEAAKANDIGQMKKLVSEINPNAQDSKGNTLLFLAANVPGNEDVVKQLLARGAEVNGGNAAKKETPLFAAIAGGNTGIVDILLKAGADTRHECTSDPNDSAYIGFRGMTPLNYFGGDLANHGGFNKDILQLMIAADKKQHPNAKVALVNIASSARGLTPLMRAAFDHNVEAVQALLARGADPNIRSHASEEDLEIDPKRKEYGVESALDFAKREKEAATAGIETDNRIISEESKRKQVILGENPTPTAEQKETLDYIDKEIARRERYRAKSEVDAAAVAKIIEIITPITKPAPAPDQSDNKLEDKKPADKPNPAGDKALLRNGYQSYSLAFARDTSGLPGSRGGLGGRLVPEVAVMPAAVLAAQTAGATFKPEAPGLG